MKVDKEYSLSFKVEAPRALVIGSGPVGSLIASMALQKEFNVTMIDIGSFESEYVENNKLGLKTANESVHPYDLGQYNNLDFGSLNYKWRTSKGKFGFSTVWGGTWEKLSSLNAAPWNEAYSRVDQIIGKTSKVYSSNCSCTSLNIDQASESPAISLLVNSGKPNPEIWSTEDLIADLSRNTNFSYIKGNVTNFEEVNDRVYALTDGGNKLGFDVVYLCCGPVGNANLILNSKPEPLKIVLQDTQIVYIPFFYRKKSKICKESKNFPVGKVLDKNREGEVNSYFQIYPHVSDYSAQILSKLPLTLRPLLQLFFKILLSRIGIALGYRNHKYSSSISLNSGSMVLVKELSPEKKNSKLIFMARSFLTLRKVGLWPIPMFTRFGSPGDSYHLGMAESIVEPENGSVEGFNRIFALGAIALPSLEPGPITYSAMAQAVIGFNYSVEKLPKLRQ
jgi:hypothetical protein